MQNWLDAFAHGAKAIVVQGGFRRRWSFVEGVGFDIGNAGRVGPAERWIKVLGERILRIHIKDYSAKPAASATQGNTRPKLLDGDTNWPAVMKVLDDVGYTGWATSEQPGNQAADVESARDLAQRMDRIFAL